MTTTLLGNKNELKAKRTTYSEYPFKQIVKDVEASSFVKNIDVVTSGGVHWTLREKILKEARSI